MTPSRRVLHHDRVLLMMHYSHYTMTHEGIKRSILLVFSVHNVGRISSDGLFCPPALFSTTTPLGGFMATLIGKHFWRFELCSRRRPLLRIEKFASRIERGCLYSCWQPVVASYDRHGRNVLGLFFYLPSNHQGIIIIVDSLYW